MIARPWLRGPRVGFGIVRFLAAVVLGLLPAVRAGAAGPSIEWHVAPGEGGLARVVVRGIEPEVRRGLAGRTPPAAEWEARFSVHVRQGDVLAEVGLPAMLGTYRLTDDGLEFQPRFPLSAGVLYRAVYRPAGSAAAGGGPPPPVPVVAEFRLPAVEHPVTRVARIFPGAGVVPENLLKFYLEFSGPMSRGDAYAHIHLLDETEGPVELPFLELAEELWNPEMTRLTVLIDPGRIKRGVRPLEEVGPAIREGRRYRLSIDGSWLDANGRPLGVDFEKRFAVGPADRDPPDPVAWTLTPPAAATRGPVSVAFPESLDGALLRRCLRVLDPEGNPVPGTITVGREEREWALEPEVPWRPGRHELMVLAILEDLAGNNPGKTFDVDRFDRVDARLTNTVRRVSFTVR